MSSSPTRQIENVYCAERTRQDNEPLFGTATQAQSWFLLEVRQPWQAKAVANNNLPGPVQNFLSQQAAVTPGSRLLFIRQQNGKPQKLRFFAVKTGETAPAICEFQLDNYEDLLALDLAAIMASSETANRFIRKEPLFLVCTNGRRDKCCAKFGRPVYEALRQSQGDLVWQSSHIGGHRYAPNVLFLPGSVNYGLLSPEEAHAAASAYRDGRIHDLSRYRGRPYYLPHVQAADYFLRRELQYHAVAGIQLRSVTAVEDEIWMVQFTIAGAGETHQITVQRQMTAQKQLVSCSSPAEKAVPRYRLIEQSIDASWAGKHLP